MPATTNWEEIRRAYVTGESSILEVARQFEVTVSQCYRHSADEGWVEAREDFRRRETARKASGKASEEASDLSALISRIGKLILQRFLVREGGLTPTASDAERWAKILLELEEASRIRHGP